MKKIIIAIISTIYLLQNVYAIETSNIDKVVYKWYKEEKINGIYYPKKDNLPGYYEDIENIKYNEYSEWNSDYCNYSKDYYDVEEKYIKTYKKMIKTKYVLFTMAYMQGTNDEFKTIKIFHNGIEVNYTVVEDKPAWLILELDNEYDSENFSFYIEMYTPCRYVITLSNDKYSERRTMVGTISIKQERAYIYTTDEWICKNVLYTTEETDEEIHESEYIKNIENKKVCRIREINTYRYKINKKYYDDNYHQYIEGYIPDTKNMNIYYKNDIKDTNIEQIKLTSKTSIKEIPIYSNIPIKQHTKIITKYINKTIENIPTKIYYILAIFIITIIIQTIIIVKEKCRLKHL